MIKKQFRKMLPITFDTRSLLLAILVFGTMGGMYYEVRGLRLDVAKLNLKLESIESEQSKARLQLVPTLQTETLPIEPPIPNPKPVESNSSDSLIKLLKQINFNQPTKRVIISSGTITVLDAILANEDPFFELIGFLLDEGRLVRIELPHKLFESPLRKGLIEFGVPTDSIKSVAGLNIKMMVRGK